MARTLADGRREELLDGVMAIISAQGFAGTRVADIARELNCSGSTLYKIAPNKDSLVVLAIGRWGEQTLEYCEARAQKGAAASDAARNFWRAAAERVRPMSHAFRVDMERFESSRIAYLAVSHRFIDRFVQLLDDAVAAGEIAPVSTRFMATALRQMAMLVRDEQLLTESGITAEQAMLQLDQMIWSGLRT